MRLAAAGHLGGDHGAGAPPPPQHRDVRPGQRGAGELAGPGPEPRQEALRGAGQEDAQQPERVGQVGSPGQLDPVQGHEGRGPDGASHGDHEDALPQLQHQPCRGGQAAQHHPRGGEREQVILPHRQAALHERFPPAAGGQQPGGGVRPDPGAQQVPAHPEEGTHEAAEQRGRLQPRAGQGRAPLPSSFSAAAAVLLLLLQPRAEQQGERQAQAPGAHGPGNFPGAADLVQRQRPRPPARPGGPRRRLPAARRAIPIAVGPAPLPAGAAAAFAPAAAAHSHASPPSLPPSPRLARAGRRCQERGSPSHWVQREEKLKGRPRPPSPSRRLPARGA